MARRGRPSDGGLLGSGTALTEETLSSWSTSSRVLAADAVETAKAANPIANSTFPAEDIAGAALGRIFQVSSLLKDGVPKLSLITYNCWQSLSIYTNAVAEFRMLTVLGMLT